MKNRAQALYDQARLVPDKTAILFEGSSWTFSKLYDETRSYAAGLVKAGVQRNGKVALMLSTRPDFVTI